MTEGANNPIHSAAAGATPARLMVVDDDLGTRSFLVDALSEEGYRVLGAADASQALRLLQETPAQLIILDGRMPGMEPGEFVTRYRALSDTAAPVVLVTALQNAGAHAERIKADGFLSKPFRLDDLLDLVARLLG